MKHTRRSLFGMIGGAVSAALVAGGVKKPQRRFRSTYHSYLPWFQVERKRRERHFELVRKAFHPEAIYVQGELIWWDPEIDKEQRLRVVTEGFASGRLRWPKEQG